MALAILELLQPEGRNVRFKIDTGTNECYQFRIGKGIKRQHGLAWIDQITYRSPVAKNADGGSLLGSSMEVVLPLTHFDNGAEYIQLFSFKTPEGKSPAFSRVVAVRRRLADVGSIDLSPTLSAAASMNMDTTFQSPRSIPCRSYSDRYARQASLADLLASVVSIAGPAVLEMLRSAPAPTVPTAPAKSGAAPGFDAANILHYVLNAIGAGVSGVAPTGRQFSLHQGADAPNRFVPGNDAHLARPFILPALIPLLPALMGPIVQALPQLMNAANQKRLQLKQEDNKLVSDILGGINRRLLMDQLLQAQKQAPPGAPVAGQVDLTPLLQLLQQGADAQQPAPVGAPGPPAQSPAPVPPPQPQPPAPVVSTPESLTMALPHATTLSSRAILSFATQEPVTWSGAAKVAFSKGQAVRFKVRLDVGAPTPTTPLPKALLKIVLKDAANQATLCERTAEQAGVRPGAIMQLQLMPEDLARLPLNRPIVVMAELSWITGKTGKSIKALGSLDIVILEKYSLKDRGKPLALEKELTDLKRFKPFWNKIWESPPLDGAGGRGRNKKLLWELDVSAKYSVLLSENHPANGLMETKFLRSPQDSESVSDRTEGRMKAGIELSIAELNKLLPVWEGTPGLDAERLEAFRTEAFAKNASGEFVRSFRLKGRSRENALIWVAPIFNLFEFTLTSVQRTDDCGQVVAMGEEKVRFPLPVAARVLGLKSRAAEGPRTHDRDDADDQTEESAAPGSASQDSPEYQFAGYDLELSEKIVLTSPTTQRQKGGTMA